jgi:solute carrier family 24 (sodium/potassium/calcium exchanger), member 4
MFVISVCALCSGTVSQLNWWPLVRDCTFYSFSILVMLVVICNDVISWPEALFMLICYVIYCIALHFNTTLEKLAQPYILKLPIKLPTREEQSSLVTFKNVPDSSYQGIQNVDATSPQQELSEPSQPEYNYDTAASWDPNSAWNEDSSAAKPAAAPAAAGNSWNTSNYDSWGDDGAQNYGYIKSEVETDAPGQEQSKTSPTPVSTTVVQQTNDQYYKPREQRPELPDPLIKPESADMLTMISWYIVFPIHFLCRKTMVDVKKDQYKNYYPLTFFVSMVWISFYSYFMVWMITIIGYTLGIPDTVMGLTFVAGMVYLS